MNLPRCAMCEAEILPGEEAVQVEREGQQAVACMPCVERVFREMFGPQLNRRGRTEASRNV